ncbi:DUF368 domain-containing protein [Corynebacterium cystitidis]|uniref:Putative membrane protein n=1 Tax=Corynebacterium cystitidis DSM 20524 TaxID=1121357 RepID=A0A1H9VCZ6_9CORY|nr:DUF368 domain-containing protein [Corynebacterium cystitidis]WJY82301.1 hypothetical protein CCYS_06860 [Corynebacterium cystitidis DSM 20524]SES19153.1 putative membrane protein [Corynebacterium cystitidis DSM 20524]SNV76673.1 predicted membrane protein [Corynebacterium cystitidis]
MTTESSTSTRVPARPQPRRNILSYIFDVVRGFLIGLAELVPGISGGTIALIVGIYEKALNNADLIMRRKLREVDWLFLFMVGAGMITAIFTMSTVMHIFVTEYTELANGLFFGMVAVSIIVPVGMMDRRQAHWGLLALFVVGAIVAFFATGYTSTPVDNPSLIVIFFAAAVAICALVLPGLSGSFLLLAMGLYEPIIKAVSDHDITIILVFCAGAATGLLLFVRVLSWLMNKHRNITLATMAGLMLGSLRALWPWPGAAPTNIGPVVGMAVLGAVIVALFLIADRYKQAKTHAEVVEVNQPH